MERPAPTTRQRRLARALLRAALRAQRSPEHVCVLASPDVEVPRPSLERLCRRAPSSSCSPGARLQCFLGHALHLCDDGKWVCVPEERGGRGGGRTRGVRSRLV